MLVYLELVAVRLVKVWRFVGTEQRPLLISFHLSIGQVAGLVQRFVSVHILNRIVTYAVIISCNSDRIIRHCNKDISIYNIIIS